MEDLERRLAALEKSLETDGEGRAILSVERASSKVYS